MRLPNYDNINTAQAIYDHLTGWKTADEVITGCFVKHIKNTDVNVVVIKVRLINELYRANIFAPVMMAQHIVSIVGLDSQLASGNVDCVDRIAEFKGKHFISFASKYAHFHNKQAFPLFDRYVCQALAIIRAKGFSVSTYADFYARVNELRQLSGLNDVGWDGIDHYLWLYGLKLSLEKGGKVVSREVEAYFATANGSRFFKDLVPMGTSY